MDGAAPRAADTTRLETPWGPLWLGATARGLCRVTNRPPDTAQAECAPDERSPAGHHLASAVAQLRAYIEGRGQAFDLALDLSAGSAFDRQVWLAARQVPFGATTTYGELAASIGMPGASRAVGGALGRNPALIVVPCHRVLRAGGGLGGFSAGLPLKRALLAHEGQSAAPRLF